MFLSEETVAVSVIPGCDTSERKRNHFAVQQRDDPANRANEPWAVRAGPIHRTRPGNFLNRLRQSLRQYLFRGPANHDLLRAKIFAFRRIHDAQLRYGDSLLFGEAHRGARWLRVLVAGHRISWG